MEISGAENLHVDCLAIKKCPDTITRTPYSLLTETPVRSLSTQHLFQEGFAKHLNGRYDSDYSPLLPKESELHVLCNSMGNLSPSAAE